MKILCTIYFPLNFTSEQIENLLMDRGLWTAPWEYTDFNAVNIFYQPTKPNQ